MVTLKLTTSLYRSTLGKVKLLFSSKYLLYTNTAICVGMSCFADSLQQHVQIHNRELPHMNTRRSRDVATTGLLIGPFCHYWYILLDRWLPGKTLRIVAKKIVVDQLICSPIVIGMFLGTTLYLEGKTGSSLKKELWDKGKTLYLADWIIWPPAQALNFLFLPTKFRVLYDNTISFLFDWYFSYVKYGKAHNCDSESSASYPEGVEHIMNYNSISERTMTGSHVPSINMNHLMHEKTEATKAKLLTLLHLDNIPADMEDMEGISAIHTKQEAANQTEHEDEE